MKQKLLLLLLLAALLVSLTGCMATVDQMYCLPKRSEEFKNLQQAMDQAMIGMEFAAPLSGENQQSVQTADLDGDGESEYLVFAKSTTEKPMKILIFSGESGAYVLSSTIECNGTAFDQVEYVQMDGNAGLEMVVGCQVSDQVLRSVGVYRFAQGHTVRAVSANYTRFLTCDLDNDGLAEMMVLRPGLLETDNGVAELYGFENGAIERSNEAVISEPVDRLRRIITGRLHDGDNAVFVGSTVEGSGIITDVYAMVDGVFTNVSLSNESGASVQTLRNYYVYATDIDDDGVVELPDLITMPAAASTRVGDRQYMIRWFSMKIDGSEVDKCYTFHNFVGGWYMELDQELVQRITVVRNDNAFDFCLWDEQFEEYEKIFTIFEFTGQNREELAVQSNRFVIYRDESTIYAAYLDVSSASYGITPENLSESFHLIRQEWKTGVTE